MRESVCVWGGRGRVRERDIGAERVKWEGEERTRKRNVRANGCASEIALYNHSKI